MIPQNRKVFRVQPWVHVEYTLVHIGYVIHKLIIIINHHSCNKQLGDSIHIIIT